MGDFGEYSKEAEKLKAYELNVNMKQEEATELGYRDMNLRFLNLEQAAYKPQEWETRKNQHIQRKKDIEAAWHRKTSKRKAELDKAGNKNFSDKEKGYYDNFTLKDMEILLKNSDRGGNSDEYNSVTTDLELYNTIQGKSEANESTALLARIKESCDRYISSRKPMSPKGKRRKAMIEQVSAQVEKLIEDSKTITFQKEQEKYNAYTSLSENATLEEKKQVTEEACKSSYDKIYLDLQGVAELTKEERAEMDARMEKIMEGIIELPTEENQSKNLSTKFFNALGWSDHKPRLCGSEETMLESSPYKVYMYHSMNTFGDLKDCTGLAQQLKGERSDGKNRQYYSAGNYGKGTYTAARSITRSENLTKEEKEAIDQRASNHSWTFGENEGSVQLTMMLNEKARVIDYDDAEKLIKLLEKKYPKVYNFFQNKELKEGYQTSVKYPAISAMVALFGYNTIKLKGGCTQDIDYYITTDRSAFSIHEGLQYIRRDNKKELFDSNQE